MIDQATDAFEAPQPTNLLKTSVFNIAENIANQLNYQLDGDVKSVIEHIGGKVLVKDFWAERGKEDGSLIVRSQNDFLVYIPSDTSPLRDTFTMAHELGHYVLHYLWPLQVQKRVPFKLKATRYGSDRAEWEANWFASAFLMPEAEFKKTAIRVKSIGQLASEFGVSSQAASIRAKALDINVGD
ncbi:hypothetical protein HAD_02225 [Hyphomonas adhaerens MHS-3]|uniref:IrrE N-terminal-like domain-containing protein n=1 Tax=Hyphomonas adhaerens MHS-3 TaxID=1280949 RepID=A0A069E3A9_9PROT|nr:ImmA/IrrE family metallo-endopeptidase [Hyphomonas adhaerens]KCZ84458.1 hypothetical protein HAD_02225 [Hyphomonas adhaerens MHS-3]